MLSLPDRLQIIAFPHFDLWKEKKVCQAALLNTAMVDLLIYITENLFYYILYIFLPVKVS